MYRSASSNHHHHYHQPPPTTPLQQQPVTVSTATKTPGAGVPLTPQQLALISENDAAALAAEMFDHFCGATTMRQILGLYRNMCDTIGLRPGPLNEFYPKLKTKVKNWKAQALWKKFDARASHRVYNKGTSCNGVRVLVIGAGPCGLRTAIEAQLLGAKVVVVEKRDRISRNNVLHLWPFLITDLRNLGAKKFYGKFCAGAIDHISIRQLQCILLKVALLLGVEIHEGVSFLRTIEPKDGCGWRALLSPDDHVVSHYEFDALIGADGKRNTLEGFKRKEFRGKLAIAITANFINKRTEAEAKVEEISGVAFIFNQSFFKELYKKTGIDLENIVYYKDETHYFVMTAKKHSLVDKGVIIHDYADPAELLSSANVNTENLLDYAREAAGFSTKYQMPNLEFAVNHYGKPDVQMFDFTSMFAAENSCRVIVRKNYRLLQCLVGDSLLEPFWPTGSGCARGFLSSMDAAYAIRLLSNTRNSVLAVLALRESIYRLLAQTTPENLHRDIGAYTLDPQTRYQNFNKAAVSVHQVRNLLDTDDPTLLEQTFIDSNVVQTIPEVPIRRKRRTADTVALGAILLRWIKANLKSHDFTHNLTDETQCFTHGKVICALINRYRPDLVDLNTLQNLTPIECNEIAFAILENELGVPKVMTGKESITLKTIDSKVWLNYLEQICDLFRGEIPHVKHPKLDMSELKEKSTASNKMADFSRLLKMAGKKSMKSIPQPGDIIVVGTNDDAFGAAVSNHRKPTAEEERLRKSRKSTAAINNENISAKIISGLAENPRRAKKRRSHEKFQNIEERTKRLEEISDNRTDRQNRRRLERVRQTENFFKSLHMLQANVFLRDNDSTMPFEDYSLYVYRQSAPVFNDRVKELERKLLYPDRDRGIQSAMPRGAPDEIFNDRIKSMEQRIQSRIPSVTDKKPKDLLRAIGKIESNDWNVREIEKKIEQSKKTEVGKSREKVPKWSREQFLARQSKMSKPHENTDSSDEKFKEIDLTIKALDKQLKEGKNLETGERGKNKVASIAGQFVKKDDVADERNDKKSSSKFGLMFTNQSVSEKCHFCKQKVYLMEKISVEGLTLHRSCLKCHHCHTNLRLGGYAFDRDSPIGYFYCTQHYRLPAKILQPAQSKRSLPRPKVRDDRDGATLVTGVCGETVEKMKPQRPEEIVIMETFDRGETPERIEFENADAMSDGEPSLENIIDENEWTDRNFGTGTEESESDFSSSESSDMDNDSNYEEAEGSPLGVQTLQLANDWIGKQRYSSMQDTDDNEFYDSSEDEEADTQTEGEELAKAREIRMQEVKLMPPVFLATDTETEAQTGSDSSPDNELNSATEISTDSEFDHDPVSRDPPPRIYIDDSHLKRPTRVQVRQGMIDNEIRHRAAPKQKLLPERDTQKKDIDIHLEFKPLVQLDQTLLASSRIPLQNPRMGDYVLNKVASTEGIASKRSLELKKRYLLGETGLSGGIMRSGSTSVLDSKLKSFHSNISECQKLLNPAPEISSSMQNFLRFTKIGEQNALLKSTEEKENIFTNDNTENNNSDPSIVADNAAIRGDTKQFNLSPIKDVSLIVDLCTPPIKSANVVEPSKVEKPPVELPEIVAVIDLTVDSPDRETGSTEVCRDVVEPNESRPRSPAHETSISVPPNRARIKTKKAKCPDVESDSLSNSSGISSSSSSSSSSSLEEIPHFTLNSTTTSPDTAPGSVPRVEIRDTAGELMQVDSLMIVDGKYVGDLEDLVLIERLPYGTKVEATANPRPDLRFDTRNENKIESLKNLPLSKVEILQSPVDTDKTPTANTFAEFPTQIGGSDSEETELTTGHPLTETELSDWTADDAVSENFVDLEFALNSNRGTIRRNKKKKRASNAVTGLAPRAQAECGILKDLDIEGIEFMDTGSEESCAEVYSTTNRAMLRTRGYVEFVENPSHKVFRAQANGGLAQNGSNGTHVAEAINKAVRGVDYIEQGACILAKSEIDLKTPVNETQRPFKDLLNEIEEDSLQMITSLGTTTEESDALTVVTSPLDSYPKPFLDSPMATISMTPTVTATTCSGDNKTPSESPAREYHSRTSTTPNKNAHDEITYEDYVRKLQLKITQISCARDSIDVRKQKRKSSKGDLSLESSIVSPTTPTGPSTKALTIYPTAVIVEDGPPTVTRKLEEITKQRAKQKDLIHDLVMDKLQSKKQLNAEKRLNRSRNRSILLTPDLSKSPAMRHCHPLPASSLKKDRPIAEEPPPQQSPATTKLTKTQSFCVYMPRYNDGYETPRPFNRNASCNFDEQITNTEKLRQDARARARLKSNHDLGLSPEEKIQLLRKRYNLDNIVACMETIPNKSDDMKAREKKLMTSKSVNDISTGAISVMRVSSPNGDFTSDPNLAVQSEISPPKRENRTKDPERRKSIIQAVSDFFHKRRDSSTGRNSGFTSIGNVVAKEKSDGVFGRFKLSPKSKAKDKEITSSPTKSRSKSEDCLKNMVPIFMSSHPNSPTRLTHDESPLCSHKSSAPPIPPLPLNYQRSDDESFSTHDNREVKKTRAYSKASRQAELKRLRIAQEIQREQEELEVELKEYEARGVHVEKLLRGEGQQFEMSDSAAIAANDERLLKDLLEIWRKITQLKRRDEELTIRQQELQLEHRHAQLKEELNLRLSCSKLEKSATDVAAEGAILNEMLEIVAKRASLRPNDGNIKYNSSNQVVTNSIGGGTRSTSGVDDLNS